MSLTKAQKKEWKTEMAERFSKANAALVAEYSGLTVAQLTDLRRQLRAVNAEFRIVKNRVAKIAVKEDAPDCSPVSAKLKGPIGVVFAYGDTAQTAKAVLKFEKEVEQFKVMAGVMEGKELTAASIKAISDLPSKDVLLAQIIGSLVAPHRGLLNVLQGVPRNVVQVLAAIRDKKK